MQTRAITSIVLFILLLAVGQTAMAGKLGGLRAAARGEVKSAARPAPRPEPRDRDDDDEEPARPPRETPRPARRPTTSQPSRKLQSIRSVVARNPRPSATPTIPPRERRRPPRRPLRSPLSFSALYSHDVCLPTVVEEHHYYAEPVVLPQSTYEVVPAEPVVLHAEPVPVTEPPIAIATQEVVADPFDDLPPFQIRFEIDYAADEADVSRSGFGLLLNATGGLGIDTGVRMFQERDADFRDHLWMGDFNVVYELFPTQFSRTRAGIGLNWLADRYGSEGGFNMTLGTDLFAGPMTFTGEVDLGNLGEADLFHGRLTAAIRQGENLEWFAGYDYLDVGGTEIRGVVGGMRFRF